MEFQFICHIHSSVFLRSSGPKGMEKKASGPCFLESSSLEQEVGILVQDDGAQ